MSALRAVLIPADVTKPVHVVEVANDAGSVAAAIGCKWIETVRTAWLRDRRMLMLVDEEGLPNAEQYINPRASEIYANCVTGSHLWPTPIMGDVLVVGDGGEDFESLRPAQVGALAGLSFLDVVPAVQA